MNLPLNIDWQQILLHLFNFSILFAILYFFLYSPVKKFMDERTEHYEELEEEAKANFEEAEKAKAEYLEKLAAADDEIFLKKEKARKELEESKTAKIKQAEAEAEKIVADARLTLEKERAKMIDEAQSEISDMVVEAIEKLAVESVTSSTYDLFLDAAERSEKNE